MTGFVLAAGESDTLVESCLMFRAGLGGGQASRGAAHVLADRARAGGGGARTEPEPAPK